MQHLTRFVVLGLLAMAMMACTPNNNATPTPTVIAEPALDTPTPAQAVTPTVEGGEAGGDTDVMTDTTEMTDTIEITDTMEMTSTTEMTDTNVVTP